MFKDQFYNANKNISKSSGNKIGSFILLLFFPVGLLISSLKSYRNPQSKNMFWIGCVFLGMAYIFNPIGGSGADGTRYAESLIYLHDNPISWDSFKASFYDDGGGFLDVYQPTITFLISIFTGNAMYLFTVFAFVFGFFYSRNMWFVLKKMPERLNFTLIILITSYFFINPIWNINGVRMWTACQVFVYGALPFIFDKDKSKVHWIFISILFHFSFFIPVIILLLYQFLLPKKSITPYIILLLISLFLSDLEIKLFKSLGEYLPNILDRKVAGYTNLDYVEKVIGESNSNSFIINIISIINKWGVGLLLSFIAFKDYKLIRKNKSLYNLLCFSMFILGISNILSNVPSGGRFVVVARMFVFALLILYYSLLKAHKLKSYTVKSIEIMSYFLIITLFTAIRTPTVFYGLTVLTNPFVLFFTENRESLYYLIKNI